MIKKPKSTPSTRKLSLKDTTPIINEERFEALIRQSNDAIQLVSPEGIVLYSSDSITTVLGYTPDEILGVTIEPYIHPDDFKSFGNKWGALLEKDKAQLTLEYRVKHKNGQWVWIETKLTNHVNTPNIKSVLGNFRTIDDRKKAEEDLKKSAEQLRFMAESMPQKIFTTAADGTLDYFNPQWEEYTGTPIARLLKKGWTGMFHHEDADDFMNRWQYSIDTGEIFSIEHRLRRHDGEHRWHISRARPMRDKTGNITKWFGSSTDIHDSKLALQREHELKIQAISLTKQREKLLALNESKDEFISLASHQLRTPATIVKQYLHLILDGYAGELSPALEDMVARANNSNERQIEIVDDLLKVARLDAGKVVLAKQMTNLVPLVQEVVNGHMTIIEHRQQRASVTYSEPGIGAYIDYARMKMVLENLIDNASKYSPANKNIVVSLERLGDIVKIIVKDEGVGIEPADIPKLFIKFSRINNPLSVSVGGTGLGLYWVKRIIDLHGGSIGVTAVYGQGTIFTISLPA